MSGNVWVTNYARGESDWDYATLSDGREVEISGFEGEPEECPACDLCGAKPEYDSINREWTPWVKTGDDIAICDTCLEGGGPADELERRHTQMILERDEEPTPPGFTE